jgi:hypothetical protein
MNKGKRNIRQKEQELYNLEKELIKKHRKILGNIEPRKVKIVKRKRYCAMAGDLLFVSESFLRSSKKEEIIKVFCHELNHYSIDNSKYPIKFLSNMRKMGYKKLNYEIEEIIDNFSIEQLEGKIEETYKRGIVGLRKLRKPNWDNFEYMLIESNDGGALLKRLRLAKNKSLKMVSKSLKKSPQWLSKLEKTKFVFKKKRGSFEQEYPTDILKSLFLILTKD